MKKRQEGYVLLYVVVVIILLSVVAMTISTISLRNLQRQQASLERTQQLYAAEGEIERFVANVESKALEVTAAESEDAARTAFGHQMGACCTSGNDITLGTPSWDAAGTTCTVTVTVNGAVAVSAEIEFRLTITEESGQYKITAVAASYLSYTIDGG